MAAISLFWDTNMAIVTSCENTLDIAHNLLLLLNLNVEKRLMLHLAIMDIFGCLEVGRVFHVFVSRKL